MTNKDEFIEDRPIVILVSIEALPLHITMRVPLNAKDIKEQLFKLGCFRDAMTETVTEAIEKGDLRGLDADYIKETLSDKGFEVDVLENADLALDIDLGTSRVEFMDDFGTNF
jgi:hypothetical protein